MLNNKFMIVYYNNVSPGTIYSYYLGGNTMSEKNVILVVTDEDVKIEKEAINGTWDSKLGGHSAFSRTIRLKKSQKPLVLPRCLGRNNRNLPIMIPDKFIDNGIVICPVCGGRFKVE